MEFLIPFIGLAFIIEKVVERLRVDLLGGHFLEGWKVSLVAIILGLVIAFTSGMEMFAAASAAGLDEFGFELVWWMDRALTGLALGFGSGFLADLTGRSGEGERMLVPATLVVPDEPGPVNET
jgi:hypothetical protein